MQKQKKRVKLRGADTMQWERAGRLVTGHVIPLSRTDPNAVFWEIVWAKMFTFSPFRFSKLAFKLGSLLF